MAVRVAVPTAIILGATFDRCVQWSCRKCRSYDLELDPTAKAGSGGVVLRRSSRTLRCRSCRATKAGVPSFFVLLTLDVEGMHVQAVASDRVVEDMVGCTPAEWHALHDDADDGNDNSGKAKLVSQALRGIACSIVLLTADPARVRRGGRADPKVVEFTPRRPFWPFYKLLKQKSTRSTGTRVPSTKRRNKKK